MQKKLIAAVSTAAFFSFASATGEGEPFKIPCLQEMRTVQAATLEGRWTDAKDRLTELLMSCRDSAAVSAAAAFADHLPASVFGGQGESADPLPGGIEVGLQFDMAVKAETHWFFRVPSFEKRGELHAELQRVTLTSMPLGQVLIDTSGDDKHCPVPEPGSGWNCVSRRDVSGTPPRPGLYRLEMHTSSGRFSKDLILSNDFFDFDLLLLDAPGAAFVTYTSPKIPYAVSPGPGLQGRPELSVFRFSLYRADEGEPLKEWRYRADEFKFRGFIDVPASGYYRLQFMNRRTRSFGRVEFVLESVTARHFYVDLN